MKLIYIILVTIFYNHTLFNSTVNKDEEKKIESSNILYNIDLFNIINFFYSNHKDSSLNKLEKSSCIKPIHIEWILDLCNIFKINILNYTEQKNFFSRFFNTKQDSELEFLLNSEIIKNHKQNKKAWTVLVYIAGDNDLFKYALRNIYQMMNLGSSKMLNILIHFDFHARGKPKMTKRYYVLKNKLIQIGDIPAKDSGNPQNLIAAAKWAISNYPSDHFGLILWDHGTGSVDPNGHTLKKIVRPELFFEYDPYNKIIKLKEDRSFLESLNSDENDEKKIQNKYLRGICFDETSKNYLNNHKLEYAFKVISETLKKKIDIVLFDACLMMGIEVAHFCAPYVHYLVGSEEVVLGPGYNYGLLFKPLFNEKISPEDYAKYVVKTYSQVYAPISRDFTESAIDLTHFDKLINEFTTLVKLLLSYLHSDLKNFIKKVIKLASSKETVMHFSEPSYIDFKNFLDNIIFFLKQQKKFQHTTFEEVECSKIISEHIMNKIYPLLTQIIIANSTGSQSNKAHGLYIYFPHHRNNIEIGYKNTNFASVTFWENFINKLKN